MPWMVTAIVVRELLIQGLRSLLGRSRACVRRRMAGKTQDSRSMSFNLPGASLSRPAARKTACLVVDARRADLARRDSHGL